MRLVHWLGVASILLAGCSSGSGSNNTFVGGGGTLNPQNLPEQASSFTVQTSNFVAPQVATVIARYTPPTEQPSALQASGVANRQEGEAAPATPSTSLPRLIESGGRKDLPPELLEAEAAQRGLGTGAPAELHRYQQLAEGATTSFYISVSGQTIQCRKMHDDAETDHCTVFAQLNGSTPVINKTRALEIAAAWDSNNPFSPGAGIYDQVRNLVGSEWVVNGGRDGDVKVNIVVLDSSGIGGSEYFGFFRPNDEYPKSQVSTSNETEAVYMNIDKFGADGFDFYSTLAHEFQHLCTFNVKFGRNGAFNGQFENAAIDEGRSVLIEDLLGYGLVASGGGSEFIYNACRAFLQNTNSQGVFQFSGQSDGYGRDYALHRYLVDRFGLNAYMQYAKSSGSGLAQLNASFGSFQSVFSDWSVALKTDGLAGPVPSQYEFTGPFHPRGNYNIRSRGSVSLPGVVPEQTFDTSRSTFSVSLPPWSFANFEYTPGTLTSLRVTVSGLGNLNGNLVLEDPRGTYSSVR